MVCAFYLQFISFSEEKRSFFWVLVDFLIASVGFQSVNADII